MITQKTYHFKIYYFSLILLAVSLPVSVYFMSVAQFLLSGNWLIEGNFKKKFNIIIKRKAILLIISVLIVHLLWLISTQDINYALNDIRIKLPFFVLPLIIGTSQPLDFKQLKVLLLFFISSVTIASFISIYILLGYTERVITDFREISIFISHIRFSLLIALSIFFLLYFLFNPQNKIFFLEKFIYSILILWLTFFLFLLHSLTGIISFTITLIILFVIIIYRQRNKLFKISALSGIIIIIFFFIFNIYKAIQQFTNLPEIDKDTIERYTSLNNEYTHDFTRSDVENRNYVWVYVCERELREAWNRRSAFKYDGNDKKGQKIKFTLIRYLTSRGLRKDEEGVISLSQEDIKAIEHGYTNYIFRKKFSIYPVIYEKVWEIYMYIHGGNPSGHSLVQRIEFLRTGLAIIRDNFWFGVGTGDLQNAFDEYYIKLDTSLQKEWRCRMHNQFLSFFIAFGIFGFLWIMFAIIYSICLEMKKKTFFLKIFLVIAFLSMLNEDTLETQAGVTYFVFFFVLFLFHDSYIDRT